MNTHTVNSNTALDNADDMIEGTGWSYSDASSMRKECAREERLFGRHSRVSARPRLNKVQRAARYAAKLLAETGWTVEALASMHKECLRDRRLFGGPAMYAAS